MMGSEKRKFEEEQRMEDSMKKIKITKEDGIPELPLITISTRTLYTKNYVLGQIVQQRRKEIEQGYSPPETITTVGTLEERSAYENYASINRELRDLRREK